MYTASQIVLCILNIFAPLKCCNVLQQLSGMYGSESTKWYTDMELADIPALDKADPIYNFVNIF